ncbi:MAG: hypothetical protein R2724_11295 [Bryobacterales bacterium]
MRFAVLFLLAALALPAADLSSAQPVYFWAMRSSLDQYMAEQAAKAGSITVTVDPKMAKAIMTDRIDRPFLEAMEELFPVDGEEKKEEAKKDSLEGDFRLARPKNRPMGTPRAPSFWST